MNNTTYDVIHTEPSQTIFHNERQASDWMLANGAQPYEHEKGSPVTIYMIAGEKWRQEIGDHGYYELRKMESEERRSE